MSEIWVKSEVGGDAASQLKGIIEHRVALVERYSRFIEKLDEGDVLQWQHIIAAAREGGVSKDALCEAFSCAWTTILRWQAGRNAPGSFARVAMKAKLIELLGVRRQAELARLHGIGAAEADPAKTETRKARVSHAA